MVYFIGHCVLINDTWAPLTNVPVDLVDMGQDTSLRSLDTQAVSLQFMWQDRDTMRPLYNSIIKSGVIKAFQREFRRKLAERKRKTLPKFILKREIGL